MLIIGNPRRGIIGDLFHNENEHEAIPTGFLMQIIRIWKY